ncbi:3-hydroxyacyl-CoA dehydrogenase/enoyl-CoA hydratase family protein [soil metagenome]
MIAEQHSTAEQQPTAERATHAVVPRLDSAVVLGAGTMGAQLACLLAGAGSRVQLLDIDAAMAARGLERALTLRPSPVYEPADRQRITTGGLETLERVLPCVGWVLEAIVEQQDPKRDLLARVDRALSAGGRAAEEWPLISSNTSSLSITDLADGRSEAFRRAFLGTHFFNPPRYARLLELIPNPDTDPTRLAWIEGYASRHLGKGVVRARDTPAFIANRLGVHGLLAALALAQEMGLGVDEVDELTGPLLGRPKSATFRTLDLVGLDVAVAVADHCRAALTNDPERDRFRVPAILRTLIERGTVGDKSGSGFYRRVGTEILALDLDTLEYRPRRKLASSALEMARGREELVARVHVLTAAGDRAGEFTRRLLETTLAYAESVAPKIADDPRSIDRAMRWGFNWEEGPLELRRALLPERPDRSGRSPRTDSALDANASASTLELGHNVLGVQLHGKLNVIGMDTLELLGRAVGLAAERYDGLVVGTQAADFSAGANLALLLIEAEDGEWAELDRAVRRFQAVTHAMRYAPVPVVVAPRGRTLGGGAELCLAADRCQPLTETYVGLVETGVGLVPAGGGSTAMARRAAEQLPSDVPGGTDHDRFPFFRRAFETVALARVATGAKEAQTLGLLGVADLVTADPERQWSDAVAVARPLAEVGYRPPAERLIPFVGRRGIAAAEALSYNQLQGRHISEHDRTVALALAHVMSGGDVAEGTPVSETYLLDLEREALLRLLGERLTRDRIRHTLKTGRPLRN